MANDTACAELRQALSGWRAHAGQARPLTVIVAEHSTRRSTRQNRALHALLGEIAEHLSTEHRRYDMETLKEYVRRRFIGTEEFTMPDGTRIERGLSTTLLSVQEFGELLDRVSAWAVTELNLDVSITH